MICVYLRDSHQLTRFRTLLTTYEVGAGALNSWEKTIGDQIDNRLLTLSYRSNRRVRSQLRALRNRHIKKTFLAF